MDLTIQQLVMTLAEAKKLVENELYDEAYEQYKILDNDIEMMRYVISETGKEERDIVAEMYSSFAYLLFSFGEYGQFFEMYIKAQKYGYSFNKRRKFIYNSFIEPNIDTFKLNYTTNINNIEAETGIKEYIEFEELPYWLITSGRENEYYLYEKEIDIIKGKIKFDLDKDKMQEIDLSVNVSDYVIVDNNSWECVQKYIKEAALQSKKSYIITENTEKILSCFQGGVIGKAYINKIIIYKSSKDFKAYFMDSNKCLPRYFIGHDKTVKEYTRLIEEIHQHRLTKAGRDGKNILLSICIPSYNRGERAYQNVIHTLKTEFDEEVEIVISNNGTKNESKHFYDKISQIEDSRVTYFEFEQNQGMALNFCKVASLAKGKYILLLSDEDLLYLDKLQSIINILSVSGDAISIIRTKSDTQGIVPFVGMTKPGADSLLTYMLTSNYMSGNIYNRELLNKCNLIDYIKTNLKNEACLYYPHMVWEIVLCQHGSVLGLNHILVNEGKVEKTEFEVAEVGDVGRKTMPYYATLEGRLAQHKGFYEVIKDLEISKNDFDILRILYKKLWLKTFHLVNLSNNVYYKETNASLREILKTAYESLLYYLEDMYKGKKNNNKYKYTEDINEIKKYYRYIRGNTKA